MVIGRVAISVESSSMVKNSGRPVGSLFTFGFIAANFGSDFGFFVVSFSSQL